MPNAQGMRIKATVYVFNSLYYNDFYRGQNWGPIDFALMEKKKLKMPQTQNSRNFKIQNISLLEIFISLMSL